MLVPGPGHGARLGRRRTTQIPALVSGLAFRIEYAHSADELLSAAAEQLVAALGLSSAFFAVDHDRLGRFGAGHGTPTGEPMTLPLTYQGYPAGELTVTGPRRQRALTRRQRHASLEFARHCGAILHTARLAGELRQSSDRVLYAREEERRRLRHELHDSLGPILAGISLGLHAAQRVMRTDTDQAEQLVGHLEGELQTAILEVRRLFETLRPPVLDQLGLIGAIREQIGILGTRLRTERLDGQASTAVVFALEGDGRGGEIGPLPAIVEIAAYRIVCEALTNVVRHSQASACSVRLRREPTGLRIDVIDDGIGLGGLGDVGGRGHRGLGLGSMRERADELGGTFVADSHPDGGTRIAAVLPVQPDPSPRAADGVPS